MGEVEVFKREDLLDDFVFTKYPMISGDTDQRSIAVMDSRVEWMIDQWPKDITMRRLLLNEGYNFDEDRLDYPTMREYPGGIFNRKMFLTFLTIAEMLKNKLTGIHIYRTDDTEISDKIDNLREIWLLDENYRALINDYIKALSVCVDAYDRKTMLFFGYNSLNHWLQPGEAFDEERAVKDLIASDFDKNIFGILDDAYYFEARKRTQDAAEPYEALNEHPAGKIFCMTKIDYVNALNARNE